ncbi:hypothetical protein ACEPAF_8478 [Sanghuangporus sanghuang]
MDHGTGARNQDENDGKHEFLYIVMLLLTCWQGSIYLLTQVWLVTLFLSGRTVISNSSSNFALIIFIVTLCLHFLVNGPGARHGSLFILTIAVIASLYDIYVETITAVFISYVIVVGIGAVTFVIACCNLGAEMQTAMSPKLFSVTRLALKHILDNAIVPTDSNASPTVPNGVQNVLFSASFILSTMSLWLQASGVPLLHPMRRSSYSLDLRNRPSLVASILYWSGAVLLMAFTILTIFVSSTGTPIVAKVGFGVFVFGSGEVLFRQYDEFGCE